MQNILKKVGVTWVPLHRFPEDSAKVGRRLEKKKTKQRHPVEGLEGAD